MSSMSRITEPGVPRNCSGFHLTPASSANSLPSLSFSLYSSMSTTFVKVLKVSMDFFLTDSNSSPLLQVETTIQFFDFSLILFKNKSKSKFTLINLFKSSKNTKYFLFRNGKRTCSTFFSGGTLITKKSGRMAFIA